MKPVPELDLDIFSHGSVRNANAVDDALRELAPVVKLPGEDVLKLARFDVKRPNTGHLGFGFGVHGKPGPWMTTIGHGPAKPPVRLHFG